MENEIYELRALIQDIIEATNDPSIIEWITERLYDIEINT